MTEMANSPTSPSRIPDSFLHSLGASKPKSNLGRILRGDAPQAGLVENVKPLASLSADQKIFMDYLKPVEVERKQRGSSVSPVRHRAPANAHKTVPYSSGDGHKHLKLRPSVERLSASAKSVYDRRRNVLREVEYSKQTSEDISHMLEKGAVMGHNQQVVLQQMFDTVTAPDDDEPGGVRRKRRHKPPSQHMLQLHPPPDPLSINDEGDSIDMFLLTKAMTVPPGQRIVSDLMGGLLDPHPPSAQENLLKGSADQPQPQLLAGDVPPPGSHSETALDERIGQFGGLIPTLYTMDNLEKKTKRVQMLPANRFHAQVVARETRFTGAGFRRRVPVASRHSFEAGEEAAAPHPEPTGHEIVEAPSQTSNPPLNQNDRSGVTTHPYSTASHLEQDGALLYHPPTI